MGIFSFLSKKRNSNYSAQEMTTIANEWANDFMSTAPMLNKRTYNKDEIYMFCAWVVLDWGKNAGYLNKDSDRNDFFETVFKAVRNTSTYQQTDMEQFMFRVGQYKWQIGEMLKCDYPRTPMFFPETLFARFTNVDYNNFPSEEIDDENLMVFTEYLGDFWNKINRNIMKRFPRK